MRCYRDISQRHQDQAMLEGSDLGTVMVSFSHELDKIWNRLGDTGSRQNSEGLPGLGESLHAPIH